MLRSGGTRGLSLWVRGCPFVPQSRLLFGSFWEGVCGGLGLFFCLCARDTHFPSTRNVPVTTPKLMRCAKAFNSVVFLQMVSKILRSNF